MRLINDDLRFIYDLMNDRARRMAKRALFFVLLGSALLVATPYGVSFYIAGLSHQARDALIVGGLLFVGFELHIVVIGWIRQQVRERFFQEEFWYLPQAVTKLYLARPLAMLTEYDSEIDGGGVESLRDKVWNVIGSYLFQILPGIGLVVFGLVACFYASPVIGLAALGYTGLEVWIGSRSNAYIQRQMRPVIDQFKRWERRMVEWWSAVPLIKSQGVEARILEQIKDEVQPALLKDDAVWRVYFAKRVVMRRFISMIAATLLYAGVGYFVLQGTMPIASGVLVFFSFERIRSVIADITDQQREVQFNLASIGKYRRVLSAPVPFHYQAGDPFNDPEIGIAFDGVSLTVNDEGERKRILRDVSLTITPGERVGIVGPSGAGKSQLMSLLVRATDPDEGKVLINDHDLRDLRLETLLRYYGVIMQKSDPFEDTVLGNLMFGVSHLDQLHALPQAELEARAWEALTKAGLDLGDRLTNGLYTNIGYKGMRLSGGQQQRLQIAATHFKLAYKECRPRIIIADEPTASLDSLSESTVMAHLSEALPAGTTMLMVAHRLSTVANMDRIIFVRPLELCGDDTQVTAHASLAELYEQEALFRQMADAQGFRP